MPPSAPPHFPRGIQHRATRRASPCATRATSVLPRAVPNGATCHVPPCAARATSVLAGAARFMAAATIPLDDPRISHVASNTAPHAARDRPQARARSVLPRAVSNGATCHVPPCAARATSVLAGAARLLAVGPEQPPARPRVSHAAPSRTSSQPKPPMSGTTPPKIPRAPRPNPKTPRTRTRDFRPPHNFQLQPDGTQTHRPGGPPMHVHKLLSNSCNTNRAGTVGAR